MSQKTFLLLLVMLLVSASPDFMTIRFAAAEDIVVSDESEFAAALNSALDGDRILLAPGSYSGGFFQSNLTGVVIRSQFTESRATIQGGTNAIQLSDATRVTIECIDFENQTGNGLNIDDGGSFATPSTDIILRDLNIRDITTPGNRDGIKLSGVTGFLIENVHIENWGNGGSAVDMVGSHHGLIQNSCFGHDSIAAGGSGVRPKGGSKWITIRANRFEMANGRAIQAGGSTAPQFFRFIDGDSGYEADEIRVEGNVVVGASSSFSFVNIDGGLFHHNYVYRPTDWFVRILNENQGNSIVDTANGILRENVMVFNDTASEFNRAVNVGTETQPKTFQFVQNQWYNISNPENSTPKLPVPEVDGIYGAPPLYEVDGVMAWQFEWGRWLVNANESNGKIEVSEPELFLLAIPDVSGHFDPLAVNPFAGSWQFQELHGSTVDVSPFAQSYLRRRQFGDVNQDGIVNLLDVQPFINLLVNGDYLFEADFNLDGTVNLLDIDEFVQVLSN